MTRTCWPLSLAPPSARFARTTHRVEQREHRTLLGRRSHAVDDQIDVELGQQQPVTNSRVLTRTQARRIHIIGFSAGTRVVLTALQQLSLLHAGKSRDAIRESTRIGTVAPFASDFDSERFGVEAAHGILEVPERLASYMSETDSALDISRLLLQVTRVGQVRRDFETTPAIRDFFAARPHASFIDVTAAEQSSSGRGHAYFRHSPWASSDLLMTLKHGLEPSMRGLVRAPGALEWTFPPDYIERLRAGVLEAQFEQ